MDEHVKLVKSVIKKINPNITINCCGSQYEKISYFYSYIYSYSLSRRGRPDSGDIDILITHPDFVKQQKTDPLKILTKVVNELKKKNYLIDELANGVHQYMGICKLVLFLYFDLIYSHLFVVFILQPQEKGSEEARTARRIDIKLFPTDGYYPALLHFTGSGEHNRQLR